MYCGMGSTARASVPQCSLRFIPLLRGEQPLRRGRSALHFRRAAERQTARERRHVDSLPARWLAQRKHDAYLRLLAVEHASEVADLVDSDRSRLHREDDLPRLSSGLLVEENPTVDSVIGTFLLPGSARAHEAKCPGLELVPILARQRGRVLNGGRFTDD